MQKACVLVWLQWFWSKDRLTPPCSVIETDISMTQHGVLIGNASKKHFDFFLNCRVFFKYTVSTVAERLRVTVTCWVHVYLHILAQCSACFAVPVCKFSRGCKWRLAQLEEPPQKWSGTLGHVTTFIDTKICTCWWEEEGNVDVKTWMNTTYLPEPILIRPLCWMKIVSVVRLPWMIGGVQECK